MAIRKDIGFILRTFDFRETSKIAHIFTKNSGKIYGLFKGFRTGKKEFTTSLDLFSLNELVFYESKNSLWLISFADIIDNFIHLRKTLQKNLVASYIIELVDKVSPLHYSSQKIFNLIKDSFLLLKENNIEKRILYIFQIRILELSGFKPHLTSCIKCGEDINHKAFFSVKLGGFLCPFCVRYDSFSKELSRELISSLKYIQNNELKLSLRLSLTPKTEREIFKILEEFLDFHLETRVKSLSLREDFNL